MPVVKCFSCDSYLRFRQKHRAAQLVTLCCPVCKSKLKVRGRGFFLPEVLLAHEDPQISRQLLARFELLDMPVRTCMSAAEVFEALDRGDGCLLLLDVAFGGNFPFALIAQAKVQAVARQHKVVLLPSVYNKTAYKKKPTTLYGADAYLELHHIGDRLLPLVADLYPALRSVVATVAQTDTVAAERELADNDLTAQAKELARLLVADIVFYHQQELSTGFQVERAAALIAAPLAEGRRLLRQRLPQVTQIEFDFIGQAFAEFHQDYSRVKSFSHANEVNCGV